MADCFAILLQGDLIGATICPFTNVMYYWFYAIVFAGIMIPVYIRTQDTLPLFTGGLILFAGMTTLLPPEVHSILYFFIILMGAGFLYRIAKAMR